MYTRVNTSFTVKKWHARGSELRELVGMMYLIDKKRDLSKAVFIAI